MSKHLFYSMLIATASGMSCSSPPAPASKDVANLIPVAIGDKCGFVNAEGKIVVNPMYKAVRSFHEGMAEVWVADSGWGYINETGDMVIRPQYRGVTMFCNGLAAVVPKDSGCQYIDKSGNVKLRVDTVDGIGVFCSELALFRNGRNYGFIDKAGAIVIPAIFQGASIFCEGLSAVYQEKDGEGTWGYCNAKGEMKIPFQFREITGFSEGLAAVSSDGKQYGYINKEGKYVINPQYDDAAEFHNGLACVKRNGLVGYIDNTGKIVIEPQFSYGGFFADNGLAMTMIEEGSEIRCGYIDKKGKYAINAKFGIAGDFIGKVAFAGNSKDKLGIIDEKGKYIAEPQFDVSPLTLFRHNNLNKDRDAMILNDKDGPRKIAMIWLHALYHQELRAAAYWSTERSVPELQAVDNLWQTMPKELKTEMANVAIDIVNVEKAGDHATVTYVTSANYKREIVLKMVREKGRWLVEFTRNQAPL